MHISTFTNTQPHLPSTPNLISPPHPTSSPPSPSPSNTALDEDMSGDMDFMEFFKFVRVSYFHLGYLFLFHSLTYAALTCARTHLCTHSLTHTLTHSHTHPSIHQSLSLTHPITHSLMAIVTYFFDFIIFRQVIMVAGLASSISKKVDSVE